MPNYEPLEKKLAELQSMQYSIYQKMQTLAENSNRLQNLANKHALMYEIPFIKPSFLANQEATAEPEERPPHSELARADK